MYLFKILFMLFKFKSGWSQAMLQTHFYAIARFVINDTDVLALQSSFWKWNMKRFENLSTYSMLMSY